MEGNDTVVWSANYLRRFKKKITGLKQGTNYSLMGFEFTCCMQ
jgi:hypothetical protein